MRSLVNAAVKENNSRWSSSNHEKVYQLEIENYGTDGVEVKPAHTDTFYTMEDFMKISEACGCSFYVTVKENQEKELTPCICIY